MICEYFDTPVFLFFTNQVPQLLYYSHITALISSVLIGIFIFINNRSLKAKILITFISVFFIFNILSMIAWTNNRGDLIFFAWSLFAPVYSLIAVLSLYFFYVFVFDRDLAQRYKILVGLLVWIPFLFMPTSYNLFEFDLSLCGIVNSGPLQHYYNILGVFVVFLILYLSFKKISTTNSLIDKRKTIYITAGLISFLFLFFATSMINDYLVSVGFVDNYSLEFYGLFGMTIFMSFLAFLIVRYKAFNIKLLGAQALVIALLILISSQFLYANSDMNKLLIAVTLVTSSSIGLVLIRSVKKVDQQKELLDIANREQENLIHFISHQIKGFFTKSRNIFSTINDEKDSIPTDLHSFIDEGIRSDNEGIKVVTDILNAANLKTGKVQFNKEKFYLNLLVESIIDHNKTLADKKGIALKYNSPGKIIEFHGDEARLKDAIGNIINNSVHYTMTGGVKIDLIQEPKQIKIVVTDTGVGLTETDKAKLFNSGGRGTDSLKYNVNSTGYGLYIAKRVIEGHGGAITAESEGRDKGSTFTIILPN